MGPALRFFLGISPAPAKLLAGRVVDAPPLGHDGAAGGLLDGESEVHVDAQKLPLEGFLDLEPVDFVLRAERRNPGVRKPANEGVQLGCAGDEIGDLFVAELGSGLHDDRGPHNNSNSARVNNNVSGNTVTGQKPLGTVRHVGRRAVETNDFHVRFKELRTSLKLSQDALADRAEIGREVVVKIEQGINKVTSSDLRKSVARGFGVDDDTFSEFWANNISVEEMVGRCRESSVVLPLPSEPPPQDPALELGDLRWRALVELIRDKVPPADAYRALLRARPTRRPPTWGDLASAAKAILDPRRLDVDVDDQLPAGTAEHVRRRFAGGKKSR